MTKNEQNNKNEDYSIRSINVKLDPTKEHIEFFDKDIEIFSILHDIGVNRYASLPNPTTDNRREEAKKLRKELTTPELTGTFVDLAIGERGADSYFRSIRKMAIKDIYHRDKELKKIEKDNPNLLKLESIWFNPVKNVYGTCSMCEREGKIYWQHNEQEYDESLCEVCKVDFFAYREQLATLNRNDKTNYFLCKDLVFKEELSKGLLKEINRFDKLIDPFKGTVSNKFKLKGGQWDMDFKTKMATITLSNLDKIQVSFSGGDHYYNNFPKYGLCADVFKFRKLIEDHIDRKGAASIIRINKDGKNFYYLSIPTHYPMQDREQKVEEIEGCILVSQRKVLLYINGKAKFIELYNPYLKKRIYGNKYKEIQQENANLCICDWNRIPKKNHMLILNLNKKLGFEWVNEHDVTVTKSDDDNNVTIKDDNNDRMIYISINRDSGMGELRLEENGISHISLILNIVERKKNLEKTKVVNQIDKQLSDNMHLTNIEKDKNKCDKQQDAVNRQQDAVNRQRSTARRTDLYLGPQVPMPKKYSDGNLLKHIRHKNKEVARQIVEEAKKMLNGGTVILIDFKGMHPEGEGIVPMGSLNDQINNMLKYDSIYGGSIYWGHLKVLTCPHCQTVLPEKNANRLIIRDIFLSDMNSWICEEDHCDEKINSPLIAVARHIMTSDMKELLKKPTKKHIKDEEENGQSLKN